MPLRYLNDNLQFSIIARNTQWNEKPRTGWLAGCCVTSTRPVATEQQMQTTSDASSKWWATRTVLAIATWPFSAAVTNTASKLIDGTSAKQWR